MNDITWKPQLKRNEDFQEMSYMEESRDEFIGADETTIQPAPNMFDSLCSGLLTSLQLVQSSLDEILSFKDELLKHSLPPIVQTKMVLSTTKIFRSVSDCWVPARELTRMVRLYSTSWEEKSTALKRLHEDYETKKGQLNIAIKRLQMIDAESRRMDREKRVMNWEKMFTKLTSNKNHGRRWKFLIDSFKKKKQEGPAALQRYLNEIDNRRDESDTEEGTDDLVSLSKTFPTDFRTEQESESEGSMEEEETEEKTSEEIKTEEVVVTSDLVSDANELTKRESAMLSIRRPVVRDQQTWTDEPEFDSYLYLRVFKPDGLDLKDFSCNVKFSDQHITCDLEDKVDSVLIEPSQEKPKTSKPGRGLIGSRHTQDKMELSSFAGIEDSSTSQLIQKSKYDDCVLCLPDDGELTEARLNKTLNPFCLNVDIHEPGKNDVTARQPFATATIEMDDLNSLDLLTHYLLPPEGDNLEEGGDQHMEFQSSEAEAGVKHSSGRTVPAMENIREKLECLKPTPFPLYLAESRTGSDAIFETCGQIPLICVWVKRRKPKFFNRMTEISAELIGESKVPRNLEDRCISAMSNNFFNSEEIIPHSEYIKVVQGHDDEMKLMKTEYEMKLVDLMTSLQQMEESYADMQRLIQTTTQNAICEPKNKSAPRTRSSDRNLRLIQSGSDSNRLAVTSDASQPRFIELSSANFYDRLKLSEEKVQRDRKQLHERSREETSEKLEKQLAGQFRLSNSAPDGDPLQDVCLPAVFMPSKSRDLTIYNPRAHRYFHPTGSNRLRLTQPPSIIQLPPLSDNKLSVINLFEVSKNFQKSADNSSWVMERFTQQKESELQTSDGHLASAAAILNDITANHHSDPDKLRSCKSAATLDSCHSWQKEAILDRS